MIPYELVQLQSHDGSWEGLCEAWRLQSEAQAEDFAEYASGTLSVLEQLARNPEPKAGVYGLRYDDAFHAVCQANVAMIPGYDTPVLRVRMMTLAPDYDLGNKEVDEYARAIVRLLLGAVGLSEAKYPAKHIKFHLRSPADRAFFTAIGDGLGESDAFEAVQSRGGWLYVTKR